MSLKAWTPEEFHEQMLAKKRSYHLEHPLETKLYQGELTPEQLRLWVANRFYYQVSIPRKDAAILSNCPDSEVRRHWLRRIVDHDGEKAGEGGIEAWLRLGAGIGVARDDMLSLRHVLPGVRFAVDAYVNFARTAPWQEAVCSSLTELFAGEAHRRRLEAFPKHYAWVPAEALSYFQNRLGQARRDVDHGLTLTLRHFTTRAAQERALEVLQFKLDVLWAMAEAIYRGFDAQPRYALAPGYRLQFEPAQDKRVLLYPEGMVELSDSAADILEQCREARSADAIVRSISDDYAAAEDLGPDVRDFLETAHERGWITRA